MVTERPNPTDEEVRLFQLFWQTPSAVADYFRQKAKMPPLTPEEIIELNRPSVRNGG